MVVKVWENDDGGGKKGRRRRRNRDLEGKYRPWRDKWVQSNLTVVFCCGDHLQQSIQRHWLQQQSCSPSHFKCGNKDGNFLFHHSKLPVINILMTPSFSKRITNSDEFSIYVTKQFTVFIICTPLKTGTSGQLPVIQLINTWKHRKMKGKHSCGPWSTTGVKHVKHRF